MEKLDSNLTKQHFKTVIFRSYIQYIRVNYPDFDISAICEEAGLPSSYVLSDDNWVSITFERKFMRILHEKIGDPNLCYKVGKLGVQKELLGKSIYYLGAYVLSISQIYFQIQKITGYFNKVMKLTVLVSARGYLKLRFEFLVENLSQHEKDLLIESLPDMFDNTRGYYSAIPQFKSLPDASIRLERYGERQDLPYYEMEVRYSDRINLLQIVKHTLPVLLGGITFQFAEILGAYATVNRLALSSIPIILYYLLYMITKYRNAQRVFSQNSENLQKLDAQYESLYTVQKELARKLKESEAINGVTQNLVALSTNEDILATACESLVKYLDYDRSFILLADNTGQKLIYRTSHGLDSDLTDIFKGFELDIDIESDDPNKISNVYRLGHSILIKNVENHVATLQDVESRRLLKVSGSTSFVCVPVQTSERKFGVIIADCIEKDKELTQDDLRLLETVSHEIAIFLEKEMAQADAIAAYQESEEMKDEFLANTTHELQTPLNGIIGLAEALAANPKEKFSNHTQQTLKMIVSSGRRLSNLVSDILDFSQMSTKKLKVDITDVNFSNVVRRVMTMLQPTLSGKPVTFNNQIGTTDIFVKGDEAKLEQILYNLIGNAIKFTEEGSVTVASTSENGYAKICVSDTGIGVPEAELAKVFQPFHQVDGTAARKYGGTGLGLSIVKDIVDLHGGEIQMSSDMGKGQRKGTRVVFTLPLGEQVERAPEQIENVVSITEPARSAPEQSNVPDLGGDREHVLVVDDEPINLQVLLAHLKNEDYKVTVVGSGEEALELIEKGLRPSVCLLDIMMPTMTGYEVCQKVRERFTVTELPVIFLTAKKEETDLLKGFAVGGNDFLTKPFSQAELTARLKTHLASARLSKSYSRFVPWKTLQLLDYESILDVKLGDSAERDMTVLFSDIRDFTSLCETMSPQETLRFLNSYLARMSPLINKHGGMIDKFIGDCIMAIFDSPQDALMSALEINRAIIDYNLERRIGGRRLIKAGVGINCGPTVFGPIGVEEKLDVTVLSDAVNVASRLDGMCKQFGADIVISEDAFRLMSMPRDAATRSLGAINVRGRGLPVTIREVIDLEVSQRTESMQAYSEEAQKYVSELAGNVVLKQKHTEKFEEAVELYFTKNFEEALKVFNELSLSLANDKAIEKFIGLCNDGLKSKSSEKAA